MATYKEIKGVTVQALDEDPVENAGSWSSGGSLNTARQNFDVTNAGTQTAGLAVGGYIGSPASNSALHEQYNGSSWSEEADLNTARANGYGQGSQSAAWAGL